MSTSPHSTLDLVFDTAECLAADIATALTEVTPAWGLAAGESPDERHYELLLRTSTYEAWLIYWPAGTGLDMHDHGGSAGAFGVVSGALDEATIDEDGLQTRRVERGQVTSFGPDLVHGVSNRGDRPATSVHVYSPPLTSMSFYTTTDGRAETARLDDTSWGRRR